MTTYNRTNVFTGTVDAQAEAEDAYYLNNAERRNDSDFRWLPGTYTDEDKATALRIMSASINGIREKQCCR